MLTDWNISYAGNYSALPIYTVISTGWNTIIGILTASNNFITDEDKISKYEIE